MGNASRPIYQSSDHQEERIPCAKNLNRITVKEIQKQRSDSTPRKKPSLHRRAARKRSKRAPRSARVRRRNWRKPSKPAGITPKTTIPRRHFAQSGRHAGPPPQKIGYRQNQRAGAGIRSPEVSECSLHGYTAPPC